MIFDADFELPDDDTFCLDEEERVARSLDDLLALLPGWAREGDSAVRDAWLVAMGEALNAAQDAHGLVLAQIASPHFADGMWLDAWGTLFHRPRTPGEDDGAYRARLLTAVDIVSPAAIRGTLSALAIGAGVPFAISEPATDGIFWGSDDPACPWDFYWQPDDDSARLWGTYPDNVNATVGAYWQPDASGARFDVVVLGEGTDTVPASLPAVVITEVERRRAAGVVWSLLIDPGLEITR